MSINTIKANLTKEYSVLTEIHNGVEIELNAEEYDLRIQKWAENQYAKEQAELEAKAKKLTAESKLAALGLTADDLKALGLGGN
jgi:hypothetical protein